MRALTLAAILLALFATVTFANFTQEWQVPQDFYEYGILHFDYNHDGSAELTKIWGNTVTVYDGADNYSVLWNLQADTFDELSIWDIYDSLIPDEEIAIFIANDVVDQSSTRLLAYELLNDTPRWSSQTVKGYYTYISVKDVDGDNQKEVVFGANVYNTGEQDYTSRFYILNGSTGSVEFTSQSFSGFMRGPYLDDMDNDGVTELLLNIYSYSDTTSSLIAFSDDSQGILETESFLPSDITLHSNFPNPFNPGTTIPISLQQRAQIKVTVYDLLGRQIAVLMDGILGAGVHQFYWSGVSDNGVPVASGTYFYEVEINGEHRLRKPMVLIK